MSFTQEVEGLLDGVNNGVTSLYSTETTWGGFNFWMFVLFIDDNRIFLFFIFISVITDERSIILREKTDTLRS